MASPIEQFFFQTDGDDHVTVFKGAYRVKAGAARVHATARRPTPARSILAPLPTDSTYSPHQRRHRGLP